MARGKDEAHNEKRKVGARACATCGIKKHEYENPNSPLRGEPCENEWGGACGHSWQK